jgi:hypothetical protein
VRKRWRGPGSVGAAALLAASGARGFSRRPRTGKMPGRYPGGPRRLLTPFVENPPPKAAGASSSERRRKQRGVERRRSRWQP